MQVAVLLYGDIMATVRTVIKNAYRKAGITALGVSVSAVQASTALELLQEAYVDLVNKGTLGRVVDVYTTSDCTAKEFERVTASDPTLVVTFPTVITDDPRGTTRAPLDGAYITVVGATRNIDTRVYAAATASWEAIYGLTLMDQAPLTASYQSDIEALLAGKLADERGIPIGPILATQLRTARYHLARRDNVASPVVKGSYM